MSTVAKAPVVVDSSRLFLPAGRAAGAGSLLSPDDAPIHAAHASSALREVAARLPARLAGILRDGAGADPGIAAAARTLLSAPGTIHVAGAAAAAAKLFESARRPLTRGRRILLWDAQAVPPGALAAGDALLAVDDADPRQVLRALSSTCPTNPCVLVTEDRALAARAREALPALHVVLDAAHANGPRETRALCAAGGIVAALFGHDAMELRARARTRLLGVVETGEREGPPPDSVLLPVLLHHLPLNRRLHEERHPKHPREGVYAISLRSAALWGLRDWLVSLFSAALGPDGPSVYASRGPKDDHVDLQQWSDAHLSRCWYECVEVARHPDTDPGGGVVSGRHLEPAYRGIGLNEYVRHTTRAAARSLHDYERGAVITTAGSVDDLGELLADLLIRATTMEVLAEDVDPAAKARDRRPPAVIRNGYTGWTAEVDAFGAGRMTEGTWRGALALVREARERIGEERRETGEHAHRWLDGPRDALDVGRPGLYRDWFRGLAASGADHLLVAGTGGATIGGDLARLLAHAARSRWKVAVFDSPDTDLLDDWIRHEMAGVDPRRAVVLNVTTSGLTVDTQLIVDRLRTRLPGATFAHVTSRDVGIARKLARDLGEAAFDTDPSVGDRFALDARSLVPLAALDADGCLSLQSWLERQHALIERALDCRTPVEGDVAFATAAAIGALLDTRFDSAPGQPEVDPALPPRVNLVLVTAPALEPIRESVAQVFAETWGQRGSVVGVLSYPGAAAVRLAREVWVHRRTDLYLLIDGTEGDRTLDEVARTLRNRGQPVVRLRPDGAQRAREEWLAELMVLLRLVAIIRPRAEDVRRQLRKETPIYSQEGVGAARFHVRRMAAHDHATRNPLRHAADPGPVLEFFSTVVDGSFLRGLLFAIMPERGRSVEELLEEAYEARLAEAAPRFGLRRITVMRRGRRVRTVELGDGPYAAFLEALDDPAAGAVWGGPIGSWLTLVREEGDGSGLVQATVMVQFNYTASAIVANHAVVPPVATDLVLDTDGAMRGAVRRTPVAPLFQLADHGRILAVDNVSTLPPLLQRFYYAFLNGGGKPRTSGTVKDVTNVLGENGCLVRWATVDQARMQLAPVMEAAEGEWMAFTAHGPVDADGLEAMVRGGRAAPGDPLVFVGGCRMNVRAVGAFLQPGILPRFVDALEALAADERCEVRRWAPLALKLRHHAHRHGDAAAVRRLHSLVRARVHGPLLEGIGGKLDAGTDVTDALDALVAGGMADELQARPGMRAAGRALLARHESAFRALGLAEVGALTEVLTLDPALASLARENAAFLRESARIHPPPSPTPRTRRPWSARERMCRLRSSYLLPRHPDAGDVFGNGYPPTLDAFLAFAEQRGLVHGEVGAVVRSLARTARGLLLDPASVLRDPRIGEQATKTLNVRFDDSKILDRRAQALVEEALRESGSVGVYGGEESEGLLVLNPRKRWAVILDEWDGSSVIPHRGVGAYASFHVFDTGAPLAELGAQAGPAEDALAERIFRGRCVHRDSVAVGWFSMGSQPSLVLALRGDLGGHVFWLDAGVDGSPEYRYGQHLVAQPGARVRPGVAVAAGGSRNLWQPPAVDYAVCYLELQMGARLTYHGASMNDFQRSIPAEEPLEGGAQMAPGGFLYPAMKGRPSGFFSHLYEGGIFALLLKQMEPDGARGRTETAVVALVPRTDASGVPLTQENGDYVVDRAYLDTLEFRDVNASVPLFAVAGPVRALVEYTAFSPHYRRMLDTAREVLGGSERQAALALNELVRREEVARYGGGTADGTTLESWFVEVLDALTPADLAGRAAELRAIAAAAPVDGGGAAG